MLSPKRTVRAGLFLAAGVSILGGAVLTAISAPVLAVAAPSPKALKPQEVVGKKVSDFTLVDTTGKLRSLQQFVDRKAIVLVFTGTECPMSNSYAPELAQMQLDYAPRGIQFLGVNALPEETLPQMAAHAKEYKITFPVLKDVRQSLAQELAAKTTPEVFVLDAERVVRYRGRIDDGFAQRTQKRQVVGKRELKDALEALLAGKPVQTAYVPSLGCAIPVAKQVAANDAKVTYHKDVQPIFQASCEGCHRPGQVGPFTLTSYADAKRWAQEIKVFTSTRQMPPWQAEPGHNEFLDSRRLTDAQVKTITDWVDAGAPQGNPADAPKPVEWSSDWMLGKPDLVLTMPDEFEVEASGDDVFRCFVLPTGLTEDKQVVGVEIRPGNGRVLHHVINFLESSGKARELDNKDPKPGYSAGPGGIGVFPSGALGGWAPGNFPRFLPEGVGMTLPKGADIVMQVHYHKTGKIERDKTSIGLYFAKKPMERELRILPLTNFSINIPPGAERHEIKGTMPVLFDVDLRNVLPHMHLLGKEMKVTATLPDGTVKDVIWVKNWDYRWQDTYWMKETMRLPKGSRLDMVAYFDNSATNPNNPSSPPKRVTFGEQTTDEMAFAFLGFTMVNEPKTSFNLSRLLAPKPQPETKRSDANPADNK
jgi:peroxiredoxin